MALALFDRVQETTTTTGTGSVTLGGAVPGFQSFAVVGNGNTCYYTIVDGTAWEVGIGTYSTTGPTLARTTVLSNSSGNTSPITLAAGTKTIFLTYPAEKSVNLDGSNNVSPLGTVSSGVWQGSTVGVAYGGTGVTTSSGANSVVLRDANQNITVNRLNQTSNTITAAGGTTTLTAASAFSQILNGTGGQTFKLPDATTLTNTTTFEFNNNATGTLTITDNANATVGTVSSGGAAAIALLSNATVGGTWDVHAYIPENVTWGTNSLVLGSTVITGGTWNGGTIATGYGGTGLTSYTSGGAVYANSSSTLTSGTLPVTAGGTGATTAAGAQSSLNVPSTTGSGATGTWGINITGSASGSAGSVANAVTFNNGGSGDASGITFNGSAARTISYNTVGAPSISGTNATGTWGISVSGNAATATSSPLLSALGSYIWSASTLPTGYNQGIQASFVRSSDGWQNYGSVMNMNTYSGGGGALQMYVPYSPTYGGTGLQVRFGNYDVSSGNSWTAWKTLLASDNYNSYAPTLTGTGATGTWAINITGSAGSAPGYLPLTGGVMTGGVQVNTGQGSASNLPSVTSVNYGIYAGTYAFIDLATQSTFGGWIDFSKGDGTDYGGRIRYQNSSDTFQFFAAASSTPQLTIGSSSVSISGANSPSVPIVPITVTGSGAFQRGVRMLNSGMGAGDSLMYAVGAADGSRNMGQFYFYYSSSGSTSNRLSMGLHSVDDVLNIFGTGNTSFGTTTDSGYKLNISGTGYASSDFRAPIFYDSNDTTYYVDPNNTSTSAVFAGNISMNGIVVRRSAGTGYLSGNYGGGGENTTTTGAIYTIGGGYYPTSSGLNTMYGIGYTYAGVVGGAGGYTSSTNWGLYVAAAGTCSVFLDADAGRAIATGDMRAPLFYDSNNTAYYVDPAGTTVLYYANFQAGSAGSSSNGVTAIKIAGLSNYDSFELGVQSNYDAQVRTYGNNIHYYAGHWRTAGSTASENHQHYWYTSKAGSSNWSSWKMQLNENAALQVTGSIYTPIFYDSDDTTYYVDPATGSFLNNVGIAYGGLILNRAYTSDGIWFNGSTSDTNHVMWNAYYGNNPNTRGGAGTGFDGILWNTYAGIQIRGGLYGANNLIIAAQQGASGTNTHTVDIYSYGSVQLSTQNGYGYAPNQFRAPIFYDSNNTAYYFDPAGTSKQFSTFDIAADGSSGYVASRLYLRSHDNYRGAGVFMFGTGSSWFAGTPYTDFSGQYIISRTATANDEAVATTAYRLFWVDSSGNAFTTSSMRAPIFYDTNDSSYYVDPASVSVLNQLNLHSFLRRDQSAAGYLEGYYGTATNGNSSCCIYTIGGNYQPGSNSLGNMYGIGYTVGNGTTNPGLGQGGWGLYVASAGTSTIFLDSDNGVGVATGSWRAPVFYDRDNTAYYVDPTATSILNSLLVGTTTRYNQEVFSALRASDGSVSSVGAVARFMNSGSGRVTKVTFTDNAIIDGIICMTPVSTGNSWFSFGFAGYTEQGLQVFSDGRVIATSNMRAPIYYDTDNTAYYTDPGSRSQLSTLQVGTQVASRATTVDVEGIDPQITLRNTNDAGGGFIQNTYAGLSFGMYSPSGSAFGNVPANTQRSMLGMSYNGTVGSMTGTGANVSAYSLLFRNVLDDNSGNMSASGNITAYSSDRRLKTNIRSIPNALNKVLGLTGIIYNWNSMAHELAGFDMSVDEIGIFAQDAQAVQPEVIKPAPFDFDIERKVSKSGENYLTVQYDRLVPLLIEAIKELSAQVDELKRGN